MSNSVSSSVQGLDIMSHSIQLRQSSGPLDKRRMDDVDDRHGSNKYGNNVQNPPPTTPGPTRYPTPYPTPNPTSRPTPRPTPRPTQSSNKAPPTPSPSPRPTPSLSQPPSSETDVTSCDNYYNNLRNNPNVDGFEFEFSFDLETRGNFPLNDQNNKEILNSLEKKFVEKQEQALGLTACIEKPGSRYLQSSGDVWISGDPSDEILVDSTCLPSVNTNCQVVQSKQTLYYLKSGDQNQDQKKKNGLIFSIHDYLSVSINKGDFITAHQSIIKMKYRSKDIFVRPLSNATQGKSWDIYYSILVGIGLYLIFGMAFIAYRRRKVSNFARNKNSNDEQTCSSGDLLRTDESEELSHDKEDIGLSNLEREYAKCKSPTRVRFIMDRDTDSDKTPLMSNIEYPDSTAVHKESTRNERRRMMLLEAAGQLPTTERQKVSQSQRIPMSSVRWLIQSPSTLASNTSTMTRGALGKIGSSSRNLLSGTTPDQRRLLFKTKDSDSFNKAIEEARKCDNESSWKPRSPFNFDYNSDDDTENMQNDNGITTNNDMRPHLDYAYQDKNFNDDNSQSSSSSYDLTEEEREKKDMKRINKLAKSLSASSRNSKGQYMNDCVEII